MTAPNRPEPFPAGKQSAEPVGVAEQFDPADVDPARVLAALEVLGWPDDRGNDYAEDAAVMPAEAHYRLAEDVIRAADAADTRRLVPPDATTRTEHALKVVWDTGEVNFWQADRGHAEKLAASHAQRRAAGPWRIVSSEVVQREVITVAGPWVPVPTTPETPR